MAGPNRTTDLFIACDLIKGQGDIGCGAILVETIETTDRPARGIVNTFNNLGSNVDIIYDGGR